MSYRLYLIKETIGDIMNSNLRVLQNFKDNNNLTNVRLVQTWGEQTDLRLVTLKIDDKIVNSFGSSYITSDLLDITEEAYQYILGYLDAYMQYKL